MKVSYCLSKEEIGEAIVNYIGLQQGMIFFPYRIHGTDEKIVLPEEVTFKLEQVPKDSKKSDYKHMI